MTDDEEREDMGRTVICPNCQSAVPVEESPDESPWVVWCRDCRYPLKLGTAADAAPHAVKILWIDDDRLLLTFGKEALERVGYHILTATDGSSGIAAAERERPDLIILDVLISRGSG